MSHHPQRDSWKYQHLEDVIHTIVNAGLHKPLALVLSSVTSDMLTRLSSVASSLCISWVSTSAMRWHCVGFSRHNDGRSLIACFRIYRRNTHTSLVSWTLSQDVSDTSTDWSWMVWHTGTSLTGSKAYCHFIWKCAHWLAATFILTFWIIHRETMMLSTCHQTSFLGLQISRKSISSRGPGPNWKLIALSQIP